MAPSLREAGLDPHQHRVAAAVDVEDLLARERDLHRPAGDLRELARGDLVGERIELAAEAAADGRRDHADVRLRHVEDLAEEAVHVVRRLGRGPERELAVGAPLGHRRVLLHGQVRVALEEEDVLADEVGLGERRLDVAELERHRLVDVGPVAVLVDAHLRVGQRSSMDMSGLSGSYSTSISRAARSAVSSSTAATAATASPTMRTLSTQSASSSWETGRMPNFTRGRSCPVMTA